MCSSLVVIASCECSLHILGLRCVMIFSTGPCPLWISPLPLPPLRVCCSSGAVSSSPLGILRGVDAISNGICSVIDAADFLRNTHADSTFREAADAAFNHLAEYIQVTFVFFFFGQKCFYFPMFFPWLCICLVMLSVYLRRGGGLRDQTTGLLGALRPRQEF